MIREELVRAIRDLGAYTPKQWEEYLGFFDDGDGLCAYLAECPGPRPNHLLHRILSGSGARPARPDRSLPKVVAPGFFDRGTRAGMTLGVVSGCFDLLHLGHAWGMRYAKEFIAGRPNPRLCAMTLSDEHIKAKKGPGRPIMDLAERLAMITAVKFVDYAIPLEQPNCLATLDELRPDYFFKSTADHAQGIVLEEMNLVRSHGGTVVYFPGGDPEGKSTSMMIEVVRENHR